MGAVVQSIVADEEVASLDKRRWYGCELSLMRFSEILKNVQYSAYSYSSSS